jgi:hypothetical protein
MSNIDNGYYIVIQSPGPNNVNVKSPGPQGAPGNFVYIYNLDGGTPTSLYGGNIIVDAGGVTS